MMGWRSWLVGEMVSEAFGSRYALNCTSSFPFKF
jgi:hypothetical protein